MPRLVGYLLRGTALNVTKNMNNKQAVLLFQYTVTRPQCRKFICQSKTSLFCPSEGCRPFWEAVVCWPRADVGETVHRPCPAFFSPFKNSTGDPSVRIHPMNQNRQTNQPQYQMQS